MYQIEFMRKLYRRARTRRTRFECIPFSVLVSPGSTSGSLVTHTVTTVYWPYTVPHP